MAGLFAIYKQYNGVYLRYISSWLVDTDYGAQPALVVGLVLGVASHLQRPEEYAVLPILDGSAVGERPINDEYVVCVIFIILQRRKEVRKEWMEESDPRTEFLGT